MHIDAKVHAKTVKLGILSDATGASNHVMLTGLCNFWHCSFSGRDKCHNINNELK